MVKNWRNIKEQSWNKQDTTQGNNGGQNRQWNNQNSSGTGFNNNTTYTNTTKTS